jgi:hypothetical protein
MAEIAKSGTPSLSTLFPDPGSNKLPPLYAGEAIAAGDACYINSAGTVFRSNGTAANAAAKVDGYAAIACSSGDAITLLFQVCFRYGAGLTPGARYFLSGTVLGGLADAASTGGTAPIGFAVDATRIYLYQSRY